MWKIIFKVFYDAMFKFAVLIILLMILNYVASSYYFAHGLLSILVGTYQP